MPRYAARRDTNEREIIDALEAAGCKVEQLDKWDLQVQRPDGVLRMIEVKTPTGKLKPSQKKLIEKGWDLRIVRSIEEAFEAVGLKETV